MRKELAALCALIEVGRLSADLTTELRTGTLDQQATPAEGLILELIWEVTTAAGATADEIDFTVTVEESDDDTTYTVNTTYAFSIVVDDNNFEHTGSARVAIPINGLKRYVQGAAIVAAGTGAPTISASAASLTIIPTNLRDVPETAYDRDGYNVVTIGTA